MPESKYPFAGANLRNLVPMGNKCNSRYKLAQDIHYDNNGQRRRSFYPYNFQESIQISLDRSIPFEGQGGGLFPFPKWELDFEPDTEEISTWEAVFHIRERFQRDVLDGEFRSWLRDFSTWCRSANLLPNSPKDLVIVLNRYVDHMESLGVRDRSFLKAAVFRMMSGQCQQGSQRLIDLLSGIVVGGMR